MDLSIETLSLFRQIAEAKSFTAVSEHNYMTQPALSRMISSLEKELSAKLIDRTTRRFELTEEGRLFYQYACRSLEEYEAMRRAINGVRRKNLFRVGYNPVSGPPQYFVNALEKLAVRHPDVDVDILRAHSGELVQMLNFGTLDCALVSSYYLDKPDRYCVRSMQPIGLYAMLRSTSPLSEKETLTFEDLKDKEIIFMTNSAPHTRRQFYKFFSVTSQEVSEGTQAENLEDIILRVKINDSVGITSFSNRDGHISGIAMKLLQQTDAFPSDMGRALVWKKGNGSAMTEELYGILMELRETPEGSRYPFLP